MCTEYYEWSIDLLNEKLKEASVVLLPNSLDSFSECKSTNRAVMAISAGIPVVATKTKALAPLVDYVKFNDFYNNIYDCLLDSKQFNVDIQKRSEFINKKFGFEVIKEQWLDAINKVIND
jgi:glycosyltransferase involved in cell wall biosynthesis